MNLALRFSFGKGVVSIDASLVCLESLLIFHGENPATLCLRCVIARKILFSPSFHYKNTATKMPDFHSKNPVEFYIWCNMVY